MSWPTSAPGASDYYPIELFSYGSPQNVSTETVLLALTELGVRYASLRFILKNESANIVHLVVEHSEDGVTEDGERYKVEIAAGLQGSFTVEDVMALHWSLSALGDPDAGFPSSSVRWKVLGRLRRAR